MNPDDVPTLSPDRTDVIAEELARFVRSDGSFDTGRTNRLARFGLPALTAAAVVVLALLAVVAFDGGRSPVPAEAMFTATPNGDWIDIAPNLAVADFDADAAVAELRALGFRAETGTIEVTVDPHGDAGHGSPGFGGVPLGFYGFELADGTEAAIATEAPAGWELPTSAADPDLIDWEAGATALGMRNPLDGFENGISFRRDTPLTIYVLTLP